MMLYAVMQGMPIKQMVRYARVPATASAGVDMMAVMGPTSAASSAASAAVFARTDGVADAHRDTHSQPHQHDRDHVHDLAADGHRRRARHTVKLADEEQVRHAVKRLQKVGEQVRQREPQYIF